MLEVFSSTTFVGLDYSPNEFTDNSLSPGPAPTRQTSPTCFIFFLLRCDNVFRKSSKFLYSLFSRIKDISQMLGTNNFWRLRVGIGHPGNKNQVSSYVLKNPLKKELSLIDESIFNSYKVFSLLVNGEFDKAMLNLHSA